MHKLVYTVFKTIFLSMMLIFVFDMGFYVYRAFSVNQRMESIMTSMQKVVMDNNYLPAADYKMYRTILQQLSDDMNQGDTFIAAIGTNYDRNADGAGILTTLPATDITTGTSRELLVKKMNVPAQYGDVMIVQGKVKIVQPLWGFGTASDTVVNDGTNFTDYDGSFGFRGNQGGHDATDWNRVGHTVTVLRYTYYVPCLKYQTIQDI